MTQENTPAVPDTAASPDNSEAPSTPKRRAPRRSSTRAKDAPVQETTSQETALPDQDAAATAEATATADQDSPARKPGRSRSRKSDPAASGDEVPAKPAGRTGRRKAAAPAGTADTPDAANSGTDAGLPAMPEERPLPAENAVETAAVSPASDLADGQPDQPAAGPANGQTDGQADGQAAAEAAPHAVTPRRGTRRSPGAQRRQRTPHKKAENADTGTAEAAAQDAPQSAPEAGVRMPEPMKLPDAALGVQAVTSTPLPPAVPGDERADADSAGGEQDDTGEQPRRKSRRGRRGGRGRNRKNREQLEGAESEDTRDAGEAAGTDAPAGAASDEELWEAATSDVESLDQPRARRRGEDGESGKKGSVRAAAVKAKVAAGKRRMFISVLPGEQVEVAIAEEGRLQEYYLDMFHQRKLKGNIYKGVIHNIDTNLQAAFVSYGAGKNGFLQIDEIHPEYWLTHHEPTKGKKFPPIQKVLKPGQEVLVQVVKEPTGNKGAFLTTWLSLAGRFLVLTPGQEQIGVSRKVDNDEERSRLREMMNGIDPGQGLGVIVRTVSAGTTKTTLKNDLQYLKRVWKDIRKKATEVSAPALIYQEPGLPQRAVRDYLTDDVCEIWVDNEEVADSIRETVSLLFPRKKELVRMHTDVRMPLWERFSLRRQLDQIYSREVTLPSGGRLVFDQTEALMAVDINSGKISGKVNFESMAHRTNMEAAEAIARQLKLRDIGGQVVIDFIEMRDKKHVLEVEKTLRTAMKNDRARHDVGRMSSFGLLELVRQRTGSSALSITMEPCPFCGGTGQRRNLEWQALQALRELRRALRTHGGDKYVFETTRELGLYLLNHKRDSLRDMEQDYGKCLEISIRP